MRLTIEQARQIVASHLCEIQEIFTSDMKLTFIARHPEFPEREMLVTTDDLDGVAAAVERAKKREQLAEE